MKPSKQSNVFFWAFVVTVLTIVISVTAGTCYHSGLAATEPVTEDNIDAAYQMVGSFKSVWLTVLSVF